MSLRALGRQTAIYGLSSIVGRVINWGLTPFYTHFFLPQEFGIFSDLYALSFFPLILLGMGMETAFFHFSRRDSLGATKAYHTAFSIVLGLTLGFALIGTAFYKSLAALLGYTDPSSVNSVLMLVWIIVLDVLANIPLARLRYQEKAGRFALISLLNIGLTLVLSLLFIVVLKWVEVQFIFLANLLASAVRLAMVLPGNFPQFGLPSARHARLLAEYGFFIMLAGLLGAINETLDRTLLPRLWPEGGIMDGKNVSGLELNGIYAANYKLGMIITLAAQAFRYAAEPLFFRVGHAKQPDAEAKKLMVSSFYYFALFSFVIVMLVSSFSRELVSFDGFGLFKRTLIPQAYWPGVKVVPLILVANAFLALYSQIAIWYKLTGQTRVGLALAIPGALITVVFNWIFIPYWGYMACAWGTVLCYGTMLVLCYWWGQRVYPLPYPVLRTALGCGFFTAIGLLNFQLTPSGDPPLLITYLKILICLTALIGLYFYEKLYRPLRTLN